MRIFHVGLDFRRGAKLVGRRIVFEGILELLLHPGIRGEREAFDEFAFRVELDQFLRNLDDALLDAFLELFPGAASEARQFRRLSLLGSRHPFDFFQVRNGKLETVSARIVEQDAIDQSASDLFADKTAVTPHAMVFVYDIVADG